MTATRRLVFASAFVLAADLTTAAAPVPPPKAPPGYLVDFARLPGASSPTEYVLIVNASSRDRTSTMMFFGDAAGRSPAQLRDRAVRELVSEGWRALPSGDSALLIVGHQKGRFSPVDRVTSRAAKLPPQQQPIVSRRPAK